MAKIEKVVEWMSKNNFNLHADVSVHQYDDRRGISLIAKQNLPESTVLFAIPQSMVLCPETSSLPQEVQDDEKFQELGAWDKLIIALMWEWRQPDSKWRPYLDVLPLTLDTPHFWTEKERDWLKGTELENRLGISEIKKSYDESVKPLLATIFRKNSSQKGTDDSDFSEYNRFGSIVSAYSFTRTSGEVAMMPVADLLNHKTGHNNARLFVEEIDESEDDEDEDNEDDDKANSKEEKKKSEGQPYEMRTIKEVEKGSDLYNTYGPLGNSELLRKYGFVEELSDNNPFDVVELPVKMLLSACEKKNPDSFKAREKILLENELIEADDTYPIQKIIDQDGDDEEEEDQDAGFAIPPELDLILRLFHATDDEWKSWVEIYEQSQKNYSDLMEVEDENDAITIPDDDEVEPEKKPQKKKEKIAEEKQDEKKNEREEKEQDENEENEENEDEEEEGGIPDSLLDDELDLIPDISDLEGMYKTLIGIVNSRLDLYPTTIEQDSERLAEIDGSGGKNDGDLPAKENYGNKSKKKRQANTDINTRPQKKAKLSTDSSVSSASSSDNKYERMALIVRVSEKKVLKDFLGKLQEVVKVLEDENKEKNKNEKSDKNQEKSEKNLKKNQPEKTTEEKSGKKSRDDKSSAKKSSKKS